MSAYHPVSIAALTATPLNGSDLQLVSVLANNSAYTRYRISYKSGDLTISGILNVPSKGEGPFPLLILNHGYIATSVYTNGRGLKREQDYLARAGFAVLHPDYRNHAFSDKDDTVDARFRLGYAEDSMNAILAMRSAIAAGMAEVKNVNAARVGMLGHSMGGGVTLNVLVARPELVQAAVLFAPVSGNQRKNYERWLGRNSSRAAEMQELYGSPEDHADFWNGISATTYLGNIQAPVMIHHGTGDESVPVEWSVELHRDLAAAGRESMYHEYERQPHEFTSDWQTVMERTAEFFEARLNGGT